MTQQRWCVHRSPRLLGRTLRRWVGILVVVCIAAAESQRSEAARAIQGSVAEVTPIDAAALFNVGFRIWSALAGGETNVNDNTSSCRNVRCIRTYVTNSNLNPGGYVGNQEATQVYNGDLADQPFYELVDGTISPGAADHIGYFGVAGVTANNEGIGSFLVAGCPGASAQNCFGRIDASVAGPPILNTPHGYGGPHIIRAIGGLNPVPVPQLSHCVGGTCLFWTDPPTYAATMRPSTTGEAPPSPVKGVRLYQFTRPPESFFCNNIEPTDDELGWTAVGDFPLGETSTIRPPVGGCTTRWYALKVRLVGPGGGSSEIETVLGSNSVVDCPCDIAVRIARFEATYLGHGAVSVSWRVGLESGIFGYYVTRGASRSGPFTRISDRIPPQGEGSEYTFVDRSSGVASRTWYYQLEIAMSDASVSRSSLATVVVPARARRGNPRPR